MFSERCWSREWLLTGLLDKPLASQLVEWECGVGLVLRTRIH